MYVVDGTWGFMTLSSNSKSGHWSVVAKANSGALSTGLWNAIDTDAVDTDRSQAGTLPQLLAVRSAGSRKGPHWVRTALYLLHASCYCDTAQTLGPLCVSFSLERKHTGPPKNTAPDGMSSKLEVTEGNTTALCSDNFIFTDAVPQRKPNQALCFSFLRSWCMLTERPLHYASSVCGMMRKTNKLRIKYQTITTLFCLMGKQILFRPTNSLKHFFLTALGKMQPPFWWSIHI